jgi:hypothetical protein
VRSGYLHDSAWRQQDRTLIKPIGSCGPLMIPNPSGIAARGKGRGQLRAHGFHEVKCRKIRKADAATIAVTASAKPIRIAVFPTPDFGVIFLRSFIGRSYGRPDASVSENRCSAIEYLHARPAVFRASASSIRK